MNNIQTIIIGGIAMASLMLQLVQLRYLHRIRRRIQRRLP